jgi:hypothetical protein
MIAIGSLSEEAMGTDAAGIVGEVGKAVTLLKKGDRVALIHLGAMRTNIRVHESIPQILPGSISINEGATLPTIFVTAYQCLIEIGRLEKGETVLIHSAAGGKSGLFLNNYVFNLLEADLNFRTWSSMHSNCKIHWCRNIRYCWFTCQAGSRSRTWNFERSHISFSRSFICERYHADDWR